MARIRTIKPDFFTSEDIVSLSPLARLLYVAMWCEADREGRLVWRPVTFKLRYFPGDDCDIQALCQELIDRSLVTRYGDSYACIPSFPAHQQINPREADSKLPAPDAASTRTPRVSTRQPRDRDAQPGKERKGKEGVAGGADDPLEPSEGFFEFWNAWPRSDRKGARGKCAEIWIKQRLEPVAQIVMAHLNQMKTSESWLAHDGKFIPAPLTYLNRRSWEGAETFSAPKMEVFI